jgi:hypothetical protein
LANASSRAQATKITPILNLMSVSLAARQGASTFKALNAHISTVTAPNIPSSIELTAKLSSASTANKI